MDWIERYLEAVRFALPKSQQEDIIRELRDSILSQMDERESALGRGLSEDEQLELLKRLGSPTQLASRYRPPRALIGSAILPIYAKVLKAALMIALFVVAATSIGIAAAGRPLGDSLHALVNYPNLAITIFAWVTLAFAGLEFFGAKLCVSDRWDPRQLPPLTKGHRPPSRAELITQFLIQTIFAVWWLTGLHYQQLIFGPGIEFLHFGPIWLSLFPLFLLAAIVDISFTGGMLFNPQWNRGRRVSRVVMSALGLIIMLILLKTPELLSPPHPGINSALHLGLLVGAIINVIYIAVAGTKLIGAKLGEARRVAAGS
jgi:hypothetical protein